MDRSADLRSPPSVPLPGEAAADAVGMHAVLQARAPLRRVRRAHRQVHRRRGEVARPQHPTRHHPDARHRREHVAGDRAAGPLLVATGDAAGPPHLRGAEDEPHDGDGRLHRDGDAASRRRRGGSVAKGEARQVRRAVCRRGLRIPRRGLRRPRSPVEGHPRAVQHDRQGVGPAGQPRPVPRDPDGGGGSHHDPAPRHWPAPGAQQRPDGRAPRLREHGGRGADGPLRSGPGSAAGKPVGTGIRRRSGEQRQPPSRRAGDSSGSRRRSRRRVRHRVRAALERRRRRGGAAVVR